RPIAMSSVVDAGSRLARVEAVSPGREPLFTPLCEALAENYEALLDDYVLAPDRLTADRLGRCLTDQVDIGQLFTAPAAFDLEDLSGNRPVRIEAPAGQ
ncbi:hypothetical protein AB9F34_33095, partial [Rhizobium leguminosarum]